MPTINDVAKRANVSPVTVSRVLNGAPNVNEATRARVRRAISELGYVPNVVARSLRSRRTRSIALILPDITNPFWPTVARGVEDAAQRNGYTVLLGNSDENAEKQARYLGVVISQQVDGALIAPADSDAAGLAPLRERAVPTVVLDRRIDGWDVDTVRGDSMGGAHMLTRHLIDLGHRRIAMLTGPERTSTSQDRVAGYSAALQRADIPFDPALVHYGEFRESSGRAMTAAALALPQPPTAIFTANNAIALGAIAAICALGLRVPHDVAVVCFDDLSPASLLFPFLTVAEQPAYQMGLEAAALLFARLDGSEPHAPRQIMLPAKLVVRHSCGSRIEEGGLSLPLPQLAMPGGSQIESRAAQRATESPQNQEDLL